MIQCENLVKIYKTKETEVVALQGLDLTVDKGELMAIIGNSGSGKSTLLNMLGGLDRPSAGKLFIDGQDLLKFKEKDYIKYKRDTVGFVWQNNARNLVPYMTAINNVQVPMVLKSQKERRERAKELLDLVGLGHRYKNKLGELSGGEQQRVAIAISLANNPKLLLADEPTGALDTKTAANVLEIFRRASEEIGITVVIVTHDMNLSKKVDRTVAIRDGRTSSEFISMNLFKKEFSEVSYVEKEESHVELAVVDSSGRLQLPKQYLDAIGIKGKSRVKVDMEDNRIVVVNPKNMEEEDNSPEAQSQDR
jgi:ABC-type lipoprotein export system ATPase subunit/bifunctional DNA-binding transcriptional regulator/antitoxin component of YhaV-PrlF toxin-antitoxin module